MISMIFLAMWTGIGMLIIANQYKYITLFEQISLGFWYGLAIACIEMFLQNILVGYFSSIPFIVTNLIITWILIYKIIKNKSFAKEILHYRKADLLYIQQIYSKSSKRVKILLVILGIYIMTKIVMMIQINIHQPTIDEDAVLWRDMKTKIFFEHKSLVLDSKDPEFLGTAIWRTPFAPLIDNYFLLPYKELPINLLNIFSSLVYISMIIGMFWIFVRKKNVATGIIAAYSIVSMPFVFIHWVGAYFNLAGGRTLFMVGFYLMDQIRKTQESEQKNSNIIWILLPIVFLASTIRNENLLLCWLLIGRSRVYFLLFGPKKKIPFKKYWYIIIGIILAGAATYYLNHLGNSQIWWDIGTLSQNALGANQAIQASPIQLISTFWQLYFHPEYNILFLLFSIALILAIAYIKLCKHIRNMLGITVVMFCIYLGILITNPHLGLLTHLGLIRYGIALIPFIIYCTYSIFYEIYQHHKTDFITE